MAQGLEIACTADTNYIPHCAAMLHSLAEVHDGERVRVHFLHDDDLDGRSLASLEEFATQLGLRWAPCLVSPDIRESFPPHARFPGIVWYRVELANLLPHVDRVLYLDSDVIVTDSLEPLMSTGLSGSPVAAVTNPLYPGMSHQFLSDLGIPSVHDYFNSGVLLLNLDLWRSEHVTAAVRAFNTDGGRLGEWPDQAALNAVLWRRRLPLHPRWNAQNPIFELPPRRLPFDREQCEEARRSPAVVHFIGPYKPWHYRSKHPMRSLYFRHRAQTPWAGHEIQGATMYHRGLRLLPAAFGLRLEVDFHRLRQRSAAIIKR